MGNTVSKKKDSIKQKSRRLSSNNNKSASKSVTPRVDITSADNETSTNTTHSVNSILLTSSQHRKNNNNNNASALSQLNPDYPVAKSSSRENATEEYNEQDTIGAGGPDPFKGKVEHPQQHKLLAQSDFWPPKKSTGQTLDINSNDVDSNQLTVSSMNQLTMNSVSSLNLSSIVNDIDDYIRRLLDAGYATKVPKQLCLKNHEVNAICRAAMDIFLSQPVKCKLYIKVNFCHFNQFTVSA